MEENEKLHKIRVEIEKAKQEKQQAERQLVRAENRLKYRENMCRKARTHRLIVLGAVMAQYFPTYKAKDNVYGINRKLYNEEWEEIQNEISNLGIENGFIQELGEHEEEYVPKWDY